MDTIGAVRRHLHTCAKTFGFSMALSFSVMSDRKPYRSSSSAVAVKPMETAALDPRKAAVTTSIAPDPFAVDDGEEAVDGNGDGDGDGAAAAEEEAGALSADFLSAKALDCACACAAAARSLRLPSVCVCVYRWSESNAPYRVVSAPDSNSAVADGVAVRRAHRQSAANRVFCERLSSLSRGSIRAMSRATAHDPIQFTLASKSVTSQDADMQQQATQRHTERRCGPFSSVPAALPASVRVLCSCLATVLRSSSVYAASICAALTETDCNL
jgi:hypothetical protein